MKPRKTLFYCQRGISLIETMMAAGLVAVVGLTMSTMIANQMKSTKVLEAKLETFDVKNLLLKNFSQATSGCIVANSNIGDMVFSVIPTPPATISFQKIFEKPGVELLSTKLGVRNSTTLDVDSLKIINFTNIGVDIFTGDVEVKLKLKGSAVVFKPVLIPSANFITTHTGSDYKITACSYGSGSSSSTQGTKVFMTPGLYTFKVPDGVYKITAAVWGAGGGGGGGDISFDYKNGDCNDLYNHWRNNSTGSSGASGGYIQADMTVTPNEIIQVKVGQGGAGTVGRRVGGKCGGLPPTLAAKGDFSFVKTAISQIQANGGSGGPSYTSRDNGGGTNGEIVCYNHDIIFYDLNAYTITGGDFSKQNDSGLNNVISQKGSFGKICQTASGNSSAPPLLGGTGYNGAGSGGASGGASRPAAAPLPVDFNKGQDGSTGQVMITW